MPTKRRAEPMTRDARRRAITKAVIPLLARSGAAVTTREMAEAAGVAEGTIFRAFPDKAALIHHAIEVTMDPAPLQKGLADIYAAAPFEVQLAEAARILLDRFEEVISLMTVLRTMPTGREHRVSGPPPFVAKSNAAVMEALTALFERHRDKLRLEPARAAAAFSGLIFASGHPIVAPGEKLTVNEIVTVLLSGVAEPAREGVR